MRRPLAGPTRAGVVVLGWIAAAMVAGFIGVTAIGAVGEGIVGSSTTPLSAAQVNQKLAALGTANPPATTPTGASSTPSTPAQTSPPGGTTVPPATEPPPAQPPAQGEDKGISTDGGTIVVRCNGASPQIVSATPAQGFSVEKDADEGEGRARVEFDAEDTRVRVEIFCADGEPTWTIGD